MPTSAHYISVNSCKNQPPKAVQPAAKQSTGLFLPNASHLEPRVASSNLANKQKKEAGHSLECPASFWSR